MSVSVATEWRVGEATVRPAGAFDLATVGELDAALSAALATPGVTRVVVDLSGVDFLDSSGISSLLRGFRSAGERQVAYQVTAANGIVRNVLEITGVWQLLSDPAS
jgi:anti-anti-sigma factor